MKRNNPDRNLNKKFRITTYNTTHGKNFRLYHNDGMPLHLTTFFKHLLEHAIEK